MDLNEQKRTWKGKEKRAEKTFEVIKKDEGLKCEITEAYSEYLDLYQSQQNY